MTKAIITRRGANGTYDEVGMNNRTICNSSNEACLRREARSFMGANGKARVELYNDHEFYTDKGPYKTFYVLPI